MQGSYIKKLPTVIASNHSQVSPLKVLRESHALTQRQVAESIGVTVQTISNIEREGYTPKLSPVQFSKLCKLFDLSIHQLAELWETQQEK
jgi:DNA-binding XRE family transcriptional regulator